MRCAYGSKRISELGVSPIIQEITMCDTRIASDLQLNHVAMRVKIVLLASQASCILLSAQRWVNGNGIGDFK